MNPKEYVVDALRTENRSGFAILLGAEGRTQLSATTLPRLLHAQLGMLTEVGEFADALKAQLVYGKVLDTTNLIEEIGDVLWYMAIALDALDSNFETAMARNIAKLKVRFPDEFTKTQALERNLNAERAALEQE